MSLRTVQGSRLLQVFIGSIIVLVLFVTISRIRSPEKSFSDHIKDSMPQSFKTPSFNFGYRIPPEPKPANATLDFQEIIYLSMPYRTDRQDALSLIAAASGLKLTMMPGRTFDEIHPKAMPGHVGPHDWTDKSWLGVWRAHADVWRYIVNNNIQSALIIEDDVDWDVNIKDIMGNLNWQLRYNNTIRWKGAENVEQGWDEDCPYGCDWDEIFVGQCGGGPNPDRLDLSQVIPDQNGPNFSSIHPWWEKEFKESWNLTESEGIRVIAPTFDIICLMGYAVTRLGAMRMLYHIGGWKPIGNPVDNELAWRSAEGVISGYTLSPPPIVAWRVGGAQDSDNDPALDAKPVQNLGNSAGKSIGLKNSIRSSLKSFFWKNYWEDVKIENK